MTNTLKFGLAVALDALSESSSYTNQAIRYTVENFSKQYSAGYKEHQLVEKFASAMNQFMWDERVSAIVTPVLEAIAKQETRLEALHLYEALKAYDRMGFMQDATTALISFVNEGKTSAELVAELKRFSFDNRVKQFCNDVMVKENKNANIQSSTSTCEVSSVYSPVYEAGDLTFFNVKGTYFAKGPNGLTKLSEADVATLPENFKNACSVFNSNDVKVIEGRIIYRIGRDKYEFVAEGQDIKATFNSKAVSMDNVESMAEFSAKSIFEGRTSQRMNAIQVIRDWATRLVQVEDVKLLESKVYKGLSSTVFNVDGQLYMHSINEGMNSNVFGKTSATAAINKVRKELHYDISRSFPEMLEGEAKRMSLLSKTAKLITENINKLEAKMNQIQPLNESAGVEDAIEALRTALNAERAQYNQVNREITEIESALSEDELPADEPENEVQLDHVDEDAIKVGDMVKTTDGKIGKVTGFGAEGEVTVVLDGGETITPLIADLEKVEDELEDAIKTNNSVEEAENLDAEEEESALVTQDDVIGQTEITVIDDTVAPEGATPTQACLVISFGPYQASSCVEVDSAEFESKQDNENVTIKNPIDGIDLVPKKYLKAGGVADPLANGDLSGVAVATAQLGTEEVDEANKNVSTAHPEIGDINLKVNTMGRIDGTHKMAAFYDFLDKHVQDKKITGDTRFADGQEREVTSEFQFFVLVNGEIEEGFKTEDEAEDFAAQLTSMNGGNSKHDENPEAFGGSVKDAQNGHDGGIVVTPRNEMDSQLLGDWEENMRESENNNHVDNSDLSLHDVIGMVIGDDHGVTEEELLGEFSGEEVQQMKDFVVNHQDLIKRLGGIPHDGESEEYDSIQEPGRELLHKLLDKFEETQPEDAEEQKTEEVQD